MGRDRPSPPEERPLRLFAAVEIPPGAKAAVERAVEPWRARLDRARWVRPESRHITVKFLGRTDPGLVAWVQEGCAAAASRIRPFRVGLGSLGVFPSLRRARVLWVGLEDRDGGLPALARALDEELGREFPPERRGFTAHLTVARFNPPTPLGEHAQELSESRVDARPFRAGELVLFRSHLSPKGARYEPLAMFPLRG